MRFSCTETFWYLSGKLEVDNRLFIVTGELMGVNSESSRTRGVSGRQVRHKHTLKRPAEH